MGIIKVDDVAARRRPGQIARMAGTVRLDCASCGAPLEVGDAAHFVTCSHCGTSLSVVASGGAVWAEVRQIAAGTGRIADNTGKAADATERVAAELELKRLEGELREENSMHARWLAAAPSTLSMLGAVGTLGCGVLLTLLAALAGLGWAMSMSKPGGPSRPGDVFSVLVCAGSGLVPLIGGAIWVSTAQRRGQQARYQASVRATRVQEIQGRMTALKARLR